MDFAAKGAAAVSEKDFSAALSFYTKALIDHPSSPDYFTQRSVAFTRTSPPRHELALKDAEYGVLLAQKRAKREKIQAAQQRRVVALHGLGRYADAKAVLETTVRWRPKDSKPAKMEGDMWMARIENKLKTVPESDRVSSEKEYPQIDLPNESQAKKWLQSQLKSDGSFKFDGDADIEMTTSDAAAPTNSTNSTMTGNATQSESTTATTAPIPTKYRHEWYQSPSTVTVTLYAKSVSKSSCEVDIQEDSVHISFPNPSDSSSTYTFTLDPLFALIDPKQSQGKVLSTKIELTLKKVAAGQKWHNLEGIEPLKVTTNTRETALLRKMVLVQQNQLSWQPLPTITRPPSLLRNQFNQKKQLPPTQPPPAPVLRTGINLPMTSMHKPSPRRRRASRNQTIPQKTHPQVRR